MCRLWLKFGLNQHIVVGRATASDSNVNYFTTLIWDSSTTVVERSGAQYPDKGCRDWGGCSGDGMTVVAGQAVENLRFNQVHYNIVLLHNEAILKFCLDIIRQKNYFIFKARVDL